MSEIRDRVRFKIGNIMFLEEKDLTGYPTEVWLQRKIDQILSIPELAEALRLYELAYGRWEVKD